MSFLRSLLVRLGFARAPEPTRPPTARLEEAQQAFVGNRTKEADELAASGLRAIEKIGTELTPDDLAVASTLHALRGGIAVRENRLPDALLHFDRSLEAARRSERADAVAASLLNLVDVHTRRETFDEARGHLDEAADLVTGTQFEPALGKIAIERGVVQTRAGRVADAVLSFDRAVALCPDWPFPWYQRAWARLLTGDTGGALDDYKECASRANVFFTVQREIRCLEDVGAGRIPLDVYRAFCMVRDRVQEKPQAVIDTCDRMLEQAPEFAPAHLLRAEAKLALRDSKGALESTRDALRSDPDPDTAAAALLLEWNIARQNRDEPTADVAADRLATAYRNQPAAMIVEKIRASPGRDLGLRWTFTLDGSLQFEEVDPRALIRPDRNPPAPGSRGSES